MIIQDLFFTRELFIATLFCGLALVTFMLSRQILNIRKIKQIKVTSTVSKSEINTYFLNQGFIVCKIAPVENTQKWMVFLIKNGEYEIATLFTESGIITGHKHTIA